MSKNLFTSSLLQFMDYFVKKYDTKKQCLLVSTQSAIIKGNLSFVSNLKNKMKPLNFKVYTDDHSNFINWHNTSAIHDRISYFSLSMDEIKPFHEAELDPIIHYDDVIIINDATIYSNGMKFSVKSHIVFTSSITGVSVVSKDYEPTN